MKVETYLINLDGSNKRLERATQQLQAINWSFERYSAYDGRGKALTEFKDYDDIATQKILGRRLLNSELGCYLSHLGCVERFLHTDSDYLIVLEDDMELTADFKAMVENTLNYLEQHPNLDWYLINLAAKKKKIAKNITQFKQYTLWHAYYFPIRGVALIWSRKGAEEFVKQAKPITMPVDIFFQTWLSKSGKGLGIWPALVHPAGLDSDILGTVAVQGISRKEKEGRDATYGIKKHKRMWRDKIYALKHLIS